MAEVDKIQLLGTAYSVTVSRTLWSENSVDNKPADLLIRTVESGRSGYISYEALIERFADGTTARVVLVGAVSAALYQESFVMGEHSLCILFDNHLITLLPDSLCFECKAVPQPFGCYFCVYAYKDYYVLFGELEVLLMARNGNVVWRYRTNDILMNRKHELHLQGDSLAFFDWDGNFYQLDMRGNLLQYVEHKRKILTVDVSGACCPADLQELLKKELQFPEFYGKNWDAFWDVVTGMKSLPDILVMKGWHLYKRKAREDASIFERLLDRYNCEAQHPCECIYCYYK